MGIQAAFTVNAVRVGVTASKSYNNRDKPVRYGEWTAVEKDRVIVVIRTEYGYLNTAS